MIPNGKPRPNKRFICEVTSKNTMRPLVNLVSLPLICCFHLEESVEEDGDMKFKDDDDDDSIGNIKHMRNEEDEKDEGWSISSVVLEKVIWPCVTLALAFSTIWVHHNY